MINYKGHRKTKKIGSSRAVANDVARKVEARLALGDMGIFGEESDSMPKFSDYAERWLQQFIAIRKKPATVRVYTVMMQNHCIPQFGNRAVDMISAASVEDFIYMLATKRKNDQPEYTAATIRLIVAVLRAFFSYCKRTGKITVNPAAALGELAKAEKPARTIESMTQGEVEAFLQAVKETSPEMFPFFLCGFRTGMRRGELIGLKWGDVAFGSSDNDPNRYIMVQRTYGGEGYGSPKSGKSRRIDMSRQLRAVLLELRDARLLTAMMAGKDSIADELIFPGEDGKPLNPQLLASRYMEPALQHAALRRFTPHSMRHTFAVLSLQAGAPLKYVSEQLGHSSIVLTANRYGHLQPGANIHLVDRLDSSETMPPTNANQAQTPLEENSLSPTECIDALELIQPAGNQEFLTIY